MPTLPAARKTLHKFRSLMALCLSQSDYSSQEASGRTTGSIKRSCTSLTEGAELDIRSEDWVGPARWGWGEVNGRGPSEAREV